jgi:hypothetical protein
MGRVWLVVVLLMSCIYEAFAVAVRFALLSLYDADRPLGRFEPMSSSDAVPQGWELRLASSIKTNMLCTVYL